MIDNATLDEWEANARFFQTSPNETQLELIAEVRRLKRAHARMAAERKRNRAERESLGRQRADTVRALARANEVRTRAFRHGWQSCIEAVLETLDAEARVTRTDSFGTYVPLGAKAAAHFAKELRELYGELFKPAGES